MEGCVTPYIITEKLLGQVIDRVTDGSCIGALARTVFTCRRRQQVCHESNGLHAVRFSHIVAIGQYGLSSFVEQKG